MGPATAWREATWPAAASVRGGSSLRGGDGVSPPPFDRLNLGLRCGDDPALAQVNRDRLAHWLQLPSAPHWLQQVHGTGVLRVDAPPGDGPEPVADAAVTSTPGVVLAILTADCLPVLFAARDGGEIGAAHAGWRGLAAGVLEATVQAMHALDDFLAAGDPPIVFTLGSSAVFDARDFYLRRRQAEIDALRGQVQYPDGELPFVNPGTGRSVIVPVSPIVPMAPGINCTPVGAF